MRAVLQRVTRACVRIDRRIVGSIERGLMVLLGVATDDDERDALWMSEKIANVRIFADSDGRMNRSVLECGGSILLVSQFTLLGDPRKGRRPSFIGAAKEPLARPLYERVGELLCLIDLRVEYGEFGADMEVELVNDGPVTLLLESKR